LKVGDAAGALGMADKAVARAVDHPELAVLRAIALDSLARYQDALDAWRKVVQHAPLESRGWVGMAKAWRALDRSEQIEPLIEEYLRALGESPQRYVQAAYVAAAGYRLTIFEALLAQARDIAEKDDQSRAELAALHFLIGRVGQALNYLDGVPQLLPQLASKRKNALRALRLVGVNVDELTPAQRADLRMPDLALQTLIKNAPSRQRSATTCQIAMVYTTLGPGGAERQLANTVRGLCALEGKHEIVLIPTGNRARDIDSFHAAGLDGLPITIEPCTTGQIDFLRLQSWSGSQSAELLNLLPNWLRTQLGLLISRFLDMRPQVVHAWGDPRSITAGIAATIAGVPRVVISARTIASSTRSVPNYFHSVFRALLDRPGVVFLNNSVEGARSYAAWLGVEASRLRVIYNGIDTEALARARDAQTSAAHRARLGLPADARIVGVAFRLEQVKRPLLWVQAAAAVARREPRAHFLVVGDGPLRAQAQSLAHQLGIADRLHMPGLTHEVVPWYELMDVVLLTSEREGTSNTALEAQALGKPVVSPAVGGMPETFIPDVSGFLVDPDPLPDDVAEQVMRALTDDGWRRRAAAAAQGFIQERFSLKRMIRDTLEVYDLEESARSS
jgi:glycosyltransferase involved in cell wall biosynthesis